MKKTATLIALAGLSMAAKTEHSFLGKKPVEISSEIDPKMVIRPRDNIDPGMVIKPNKNIDKGIFVKSKRPQQTISADDDELLLIYRPSDNIDPKMVIKPRDNVDPKMVIKPKKTQGTILMADDNDDELLSIYRPADNIDPGMVRRPPVGSEIDPKFIIKPPRDLDRGIFVRPRPRGEPVWVDDEMRLVRGTDIDHGMIIKPKRGDIDPGMVKKPVQGGEIDPKIFVKPKVRTHMLYADDDEMMVRRPPSENIKYDAENDDELAFISAKQVREPRYIGDFPTHWPGKPVYADAEDNELAHYVGVSDQGIPNGKSHDDELMYQKFPAAVSDLGIPARPMGHMYVRDDEFAFVRNKTKPLIGDFPIHWPGQPVYADDADDDMMHLFVSDPILPKGKFERDDEFAQMTEFVREPRIIGEHGKSADDELAFVSNRIDPGMVRRPPFDTIDQGMIRRPRNDIKYFDAENDDELAVLGHVREPRLIGDFPTKPWPGQPVYADDELAVFRNKTKPLVGDFPINWPGKPIYADAEDDELIMFADHSLDRPRRGVFDPKELTKPWYQQQQQTMYADDADDELIFLAGPELKADGKIHHHKGEQKKFEKTSSHKVNDLKTGKQAKPVKPVKEVQEADDELILFADKSLDARLERRKVPIDLKELTKPWYQQQQTMYADDSLVALGELLEDN